MSNDAENIASSEVEQQERLYNRANRPSKKRALRDKHLRKTTRQSQSAKHAVIIDMKMRGATAVAISEAINLPVSTVKDIISRFQPIFRELENVQEFRTVKADIFAAAQLAGLKSAFSGNKLEKAGFGATIEAVERLNKMERLESNQSTDNVAHIFKRMPVKD